MDNDFIKYLQENKDKETQVQLRLFDNKNGKVAYKTLTYSELIIIMASVNIEWNNPKEEGKQHGHKY